MEDWVIPVAVSLGVVLPLSLYIFLSLFFFYKPHILHKRKRLQAFRGKSVSHRGGDGEKLEGTMAAFTNAVQHEADVLELDVRLTSDDVILVFHDDTLERCCGVNKLVRETKYEELPLLKPPLGLYYKKGHLTQGEDRKILTLKEVFQNFSNKPIMIEIKGTEELLVQKVSELIKEYGREDTTLWGSESNDTSSFMYAQNPKIPLFFSYKRGLIMLLLYYTGLLPFVRLKESALLAPMPSIELDPENKFQLSLCSKITKWLTDKLFMRPSLFWHLSERGIDIYLFVLNKKSEFDRAFKHLKVTGVLTDFPSVLQEYLKTDCQTATTSDPLLQTDQ